MKEKKKKETADDKIKEFLKKAKERLDYEIQFDSENRKEAKECLMFTVPGNQWNKKEKEDRSKDGRPCLEIPIFPKFVAQVVGDMLHNRARVSVKPVDSKSDPRVAKIRGGIISNTEYISNAEDIYLEAGKMQVTCGYGAWRVGTRYCEDNPFLQEIYMEGIPDPFMVYLDSRRKDQAGADATYGFVLEKMLKDDFEKGWPDAEMPGKVPKDNALNVWYDDKTVTVAEYFIVKPEEQEFCQFEDGTVREKDDAEKYIADWEALYEERLSQIQAITNDPAAQPDQAGGMAPPSVPPAAPMPPQPIPAGSQAPPGPPKPGMPTQPPKLPPMPTKPKIIKRRKTPVNRIRHYTITMEEILPPRQDGWEKYREEDKIEPETLLEGNLVPGRYIPLVEVSGPTLNIEGKRYRKGMLKDAKDTIRLINFYETALAETIMVAPKSPWMATPAQIEGFETDYATANTKNMPVMFYNPVTADNGSLIPPPMRQQPGQPPVALFTQVQRAHDNLKSVLGMFGGDVGEVGPERSAPAVMAKQRPGDVSSYVYSYNLNRAIEHSGKIIDSMIPAIYDSERDIRIRNNDDTEITLPINTTVETVQKNIKSNPGRYKGINQQELTRLIQMKGKGASFNDITAGKYDIVVTVGPSYSTQRQETAHMLMMMAQSDPQGMAQFRDILFENMDHKDAERMASRARRTLPAGMAKLREGETPFQPPPNPAMILQMQKIQTEQAKEKTAQAKEQVNLLQARVKMIELYKETKETDKGIRTEILKILEALHPLEIPHGA